MKNWKRFLAIFTVCAVLIGAMYKPIKSQAVVPIVLTAWEILEILLLSAGVTYETYNILDDVIPDEFKEEWVNSFCNQLESAKEGVGNAVSSFIDTYKNTYEATAAVTMAMGRLAWENFRDALDILFGSEDTMDVIAGAEYTFTSADSYLEYLGIVDDIKSSEANSLITNTNRFLDYVDANNQKISALFVKCKIGNNNFSLIFSCSSEEALSMQAEYNIEKGWLDIVVSGNPDMGMCYRRNNSSGYSMYKVFSQWDEVHFPSGKNDISDISSQMLISGSVVSLKENIGIKPGYQSLLRDKNKVLVTPGNKVKDGTLTGDIVWTIPAELADVLQGVLDDVITVEDALAQLKVIPVDGTDEEAIEDAMAAVGAIPDVPPDLPDDPPYDGDYTLNLASFFPFCLPFDFVDLIRCLQATPQAPKFAFSLPTGYNGSAVIWNEYEIDLSMFDQVAAVCRTFETIAFCVGLVMITRNQFIRG